MSRIDGAVWERLSNDTASGESLLARHAAPDATHQLLAAIDAEGRRHLLVELREGEAQLTDRQSRGISVTTRDLSLDAASAHAYVDVVCHDSTGHDLFDLIAGEIAEQLASETAASPDVVGRVLSKWRRFWGNLPREVLSPEAQLGLFAELWFLLNWIEPTIGGKAAVSYWRGPLGARHDFEWALGSVEVKATRSQRGHIHFIHGLEQLLPPSEGNLYLFSLNVREEPAGTESLVTMMQRGGEILGADLDALGELERLAARVGYSPAHHDDYDKSRFRIVSERLYSVASGFPSITPISFTDGVPEGVERVEYEINLGAAGGFLLFGEPTALTPAFFQGSLVHSATPTNDPE